jgi:hypothetical protein
MYCGMSIIHEGYVICEWKVSGCHSREEFGPANGIEGKFPVYGEQYSVGWVGAEGGVDGVADVIPPTLDANPELQRGSDGLASVIILS